MWKKTEIKIGEKHVRTVAKAISWRVIATLTTMSIVFLFTRRIILSLEVGLVEVVSKMLFYYIHERVWHRISWGKLKHPLSSIRLKRALEPDDMEKLKGYLKDLGYLD